MQNPLHKNTSTELPTERMGCCCPLVFVSEDRLGAEFHRYQLLSLVYHMILCGLQNYINMECLTACLAYIVQMFPDHNFCLKLLSHSGWF